MASLYEHDRSELIGKIQSLFTAAGDYSMPGFEDLAAIAGIERPQKPQKED